MQSLSSISNDYKNKKSLSSDYTQKKQSPFFKPFIQPKLTINQPNDIYEQEAEAVAEKVMRMTANENTFFKPATNSIQRKCEACEEEEKQTQRKENSSNQAHAGSEVSSYMESISSKGSPLPDDSKNFFESRFGYDFSD